MLRLTLKLASDVLYFVFKMVKKSFKIKAVHLFEVWADNLMPLDILLQNCVFTGKAVSVDLRDRLIASKSQRIDFPTKFHMLLPIFWFLSFLWVQLLFYRGLTSGMDLNMTTMIWSIIFFNSDQSISAWPCTKKDIWNRFLVALNLHWPFFSLLIFW